MAFPQTLNALSPLNTDSPATGAAEFRNLKQFVLDVLGMTSGSTYTANVLGIALNGDVSLTSGALTTDRKNLSGTATWNAGATTFTGWKLNITDTSSAAASLLLDLQVGGVSKFKVDKAGAITFTGALATPTSVAIAQGVITADAAHLTSTTTWNNAGVTFNGWKMNVTDTASAAGSLLLDLQVGAVSKFNVTKAGAVTTPSSISAATVAITTSGTIGGIAISTVDDAQVYAIALG
jgi:hypothetical protein